VAKKRYVSKQSNTTAVSACVTNIVSESQRFTLPSYFGSSRIAKRSREQKYNDSCLSLGVYVYRWKNCPWYHMSRVQQSVTKQFIDMYQTKYTLCY